MPQSPQAQRFLDQRARVLCEAARAFKIAVLDMQNQWYAGDNARFANDTVILDDPRNQTEGLTPIHGSNVHNAVGNLIDAAAVINSEIVGLLCVRAVEVR